MSLNEQLSRLLAGDLPDDEARALRARIDADPEVAAAWARMQSLARGLVTLPDPALPAHLVDAVAAKPQRAGGLALPWWGLPAAAAALLALLAWPSAESPLARIALGPGSHVVDGQALVAVGDTTAHIDGRARLVLAEEKDMKTAAAAGAAAGALLTIAVYEGTAMLSGPEGETEVAAGETWSAPDAPGVAPEEESTKAPSPPVVSVATLDECKDSVDELASSLEQAQMEAAFLRGQLATHEGDPVPWPEDVPDALLPQNLELAFAEAFDGIGTIVSMNCEEYPCIVVVDEGADPDPDAWRDALESIEGDLGDVSAMVGRSQIEDDAGSHTLGAYAISGETSGQPPGPRTKFRMDQAMEMFGQE